MGGYIIINLKKDAFTVGTAKEVTNSFAIFNSDKPVMVYGLKIGDTEYKPFFCPELKVTADGLEGVVAGYKFEVTEDDDKIKFSTI